jgi:hypothetical protein
MRLWLLVILTLNVQPYGWEIEGHSFSNLNECRTIASEINDKQNYRNKEANKTNELVLEQVYAWCEKN